MQRTTFEESIHGDAWSLKTLKEFAGGKLVMHAWLSRGFVSLENLTKWRFDNNHETAKTALESVKNCMSTLLSLETLPETKYDDVVNAADAAQNSVLEGEGVSRWCITKLDGGSGSSPIPLPDFFKVPLDRTICIWKRELDEWTLKQRKQIDKKGTDQLPPKSHEKYEKWLKDNKRRIIINKERKMQVLNFQAKSLTTLTKKCLILELHLNEDSSLWRLRAGNGELFKLSLLQGIQASTDIPKELDCDAGWDF